MGLKSKSNVATFRKKIDFGIRRDHGKNSNECRVYESVDYKNLSWDISQ